MHHLLVRVSKLNRRCDGADGAGRMFSDSGPFVAHEVGIEREAPRGSVMGYGEVQGPITGSPWLQ